MPEFNSHLKLRRDDSYVRKQTTIGANKIILELPESSYLENERIAGSVLLKIQSKLNAKRITLQIIGELNYIIREPINSNNQQNGKNVSLNKVMDSYKKSTSLAGIKRQRTVVAHAAYAYSNFAGMQHNDSSTFSFLAEKKKTIGSPSHQALIDRKDLVSFAAATPNLNHAKSVKKTGTIFNRSVTRSNTKIHPMTRQATQATTEVFCHYLVPIFQFKNYLQPGKYKFPFHFSFSKLHAPTIDFSRDNFKLFIKYTLIAEVEEEPEEDSMDEEDDEDFPESERKRRIEKKPNLRCVAQFDVYWNYKKHIADSDFYTENELQKELNFTLPKPLCCFLKNKIHAEVWMPKTIFGLNDFISFTVKIHGPLKPKNVDLHIDLLEEISNSLIEYRDASSTRLSISCQKEFEDGVITFSGDIDLGSRATVNSLRSDDWNISHILELYISTNTFLSKHQEKYMVPILIIPQVHEHKQKLEATPREIKLLKEAIDDDKPLMLPYSKIKLEDRYDIIRNQNFSNPVEIDME